jgi:carboxylate-amine ligase
MMKEQLVFKGNKRALTLGVELELQVLDAKTLLLTPRANEILDKASHQRLKPEFFQSTLEIITGVCTTVHEAQSDLAESIQRVSDTASQLGLRIASTGTHPEADYRDRLVTPSLRYDELMDRNQWIIRRMAVYGMHVHLAMRSGDACIRFHNFFLHFVPHLIALSASSPFYQKLNTGLAASRPTTYEAMPTSGMPYVVKNWRAFNSIYHSLIKTGSINGMRDLWLDLRPSPALGTLELRICDQPATLHEAMAIVAYIHLLAVWYDRNHAAWESNHRTLYRWVFRENKWRAIRYGLRGEMIHASSKKTYRISENIEHWLSKIKIYSSEFGYDHHLQVIRELIQKGNSSERQIRLYNRTNNLHDVTLHNVLEFERNEPRWN